MSPEEKDARIAELEARVAELEEEREELLKCRAQWVKDIDSLMDTAERCIRDGRKQLDDMERDT